jgi:anti-sigma factor RsiW
VTCREAADFIADYLSGELAGEPRALFERHLTRCPSCVQYVASYQASVALGRQAFEDDADALDEMPEELVKAILAARQR